MKENSVEKKARGLWRLTKQTVVFLSVISLCSYELSAAAGRSIFARKQTVRVTLGNFAGVQTNALEFMNIFEGKTLKKSYRKLMAIGQAVKEDGKTTLGEFLPKSEKNRLIFNFLPRFYSKCNKTQENYALLSANSFYEKCKKTPLSALVFNGQSVDCLEKEVKFSQFDEEMRKNNIRLYSPMYNTEINWGDVSHEGCYNAERASIKWINHLSPMLTNKDISLGDVKINDELSSLPVKLMLIEAFNLAIIRDIVEKNAFDDLRRVREAFYKSALGNMEEKIKTMAALLTENSPHAICVNEAPQEFVDFMQRNHGYIPVRKPKNSSHPSRLLIKEAKLAEKTVLQLESRHLKSYLPQAEDPELVRKIKEHTLKGSNKIAAAIVKFKGVKKPVALLCSQAGSKGEGSVAAIGGFKNLIDEQSNWSKHDYSKPIGGRKRKKVVAMGGYKELIGGENNFWHNDSLSKHDAPERIESLNGNEIIAIAMQDCNTSNHDEEKISLSWFLSEIKTLGFTSIWGSDPKKHPNTTDKTRTYLQTQPEKAMKEVRDPSDIISILGFQVAKKKVTSASRTLTEEHPSDHSIMYATLEVK